MTRRGICAVVGCGKIVHGRIWCSMHYRRWQKYGDVNYRVTPEWESDESRFWSYVNKGEECWLWGGNRVANGYGQVRFHGRMCRAHRVAYELAFGVIPAGRQVCHRCDVRLCVRPDHLFVGTDRENTDDMLDKGRQACGERHGMAKLTAEKVAIIRSRLAAGETQKAVAADFGVTDSTVNRIARNKLWKEAELRQWMEQERRRW